MALTPSEVESQCQIAEQKTGRTEGVQSGAGKQLRRLLHPSRKQLRMVWTRAEAMEVARNG